MRRALLGQKDARIDNSVDHRRMGEKMHSIEQESRSRETDEKNEVGAPKTSSLIWLDKRA